MKDSAPTGEQKEALSEAIYHWSQGHPYLTQRLCSLIENSEEYRNESIEDVKEFVKTLVEDHIIYAEIEPNLNHILRYLRHEKDGESYTRTLREILEGQQTRGGVTLQDLSAIGIVKRDGSYYDIRNEIYREALRNHFEKTLFDAQYPSWSTHILETLQRQSRLDLHQFPGAYQEDTRTKFIDEYPRLNLIYHADTKTLQVAEEKRISEFNAEWQTAQNSMTDNHVEAFQGATAQITQLLCQALGFKPLEQSNTFAQLYGQMLDASNPAFRLNVRPHFPVVYAYKADFNEADISNISGLLHNLGMQGDYFALLVAFENPEHLRRLVDESSYRYDFIVLTRNQLWEILADKESVRRLTEFILAQVDLTRVSPFVTGGPVPEKMFFGRAGQEKTLLQSISRSSFAIIANRQIGKTSLLNRFHAKITKDPRYQCFYVDLQSASK